MPGPAVVIGVGNPYRRDDGVGPAVIARLREWGLPGVRLVESDGEPARLIELWEGAPLAVLVDAVRAEPPEPGRVHRLVVPPRYAVGAGGTHGVDLGTAVELARVLDRLPRRLVLLAVEPGETGAGPGLSAPVARAVDRVAAEVAVELGVLRCA